MRTIRGEEEEEEEGVPPWGISSFYVCMPWALSTFLVSVFPLFSSKVSTSLSFLPILPKTLLPKHSAILPLFFRYYSAILPCFTLQKIPAL